MRRIAPPDCAAPPRPTTRSSATSLSVTTTSASRLCTAVYQTATPRVYDGQTRPSRGGANGWVVRDMDDEATFGVELYRRTYTEAVRNGWLADYRIIALGVNDPALFSLANQLASEQPKTKNALSAAEFTKGLVLALVLGGATRADAGKVGGKPPVVEVVHSVLELRREVEVDGDGAPDDEGDRVGRPVDGRQRRGQPGSLHHGASRRVQQRLPARRGEGASGAGHAQRSARRRQRRHLRRGQPTARTCRRSRSWHRARVPST